MGADSNGDSQTLSRIPTKRGAVHLVNQDARRIQSMSPSNLSAFELTVVGFFSSQAARRDQNRIAQREFRLRKQQRVGSGSLPNDYLMLIGIPRG